MTTVIITRPKSKQKDALKTFKSNGFDVFSAPCFDATPNTNIKTEWLSQATQSDVLIILNSHAIDAVLKKNPDFSVSQQTRVIGIGEAVAVHWQKHFNHPIIQAGGNSESVIAHLEQIKPNNTTVLTSSGGREIIKAYALEKRIHFVQLNCYTKRHLVLDLAAWQTILNNQADLILTANSGQLLLHIQNQLPDDLWQKILATPLITGAPRISEVAKKLGFIEIQTANSPSNQDMLQALIHKKSVG